MQDTDRPNEAQQIKQPMRLGIIARVIEFSARNRVLVVVAALVLALLGLWSARNASLDALPDLSDTQVIVATEWMGRNPTLIEDQITYPIVTTFLGAPRVKTVRGLTMFGMSFVYVVFKDGTDLYWARSRVVEYLSRVREQLPAGVDPQLGPDATSVGWVFQYALVDETGTRSLMELRSLQDWHIRYALQGVEGVSEVASIGGFEKEYQVEIDPTRMKALGLSIAQIAGAVRTTNDETGGRVIEMAQHEYSIRGRGYVKGKEDIERAVISTRTDGTPICIANVATVSVGGNIRRGLAELDGRGEVVGGIIVMRVGENALNVAERVKARIRELQESLPEGIRIVTTYDRSTLIVDSVKTLLSNVAQIVAIVLVIITLFLFHIRSSLVNVITLIVATSASFIAFYLLRITINIMSLAGVILALGDMVDSGVVLVENAHKKIEEAEQNGENISRSELVIAAARELGPSMFGALLVLTVAFLPVFILEGEEGRLFQPLALAKTACMAVASVLSITLVPVLMIWFLKGKIRPEAKHPINRWCIAAYRPVLTACLRLPWLVVGAAALLTAASIYPFSRLGSEFMPPLFERDLLFMPITLPSIPIEHAKELLRWQDQQIREVPEVESVFGKAGRAETALDPAPLSMFETVIQLKPRKQWRSGMTLEQLIRELEQRVQTPGVQGAWTMPIKARIDMLATGIRTPIGIKVFGPDLKTITEINDQLELVLRNVPGTRSVYAEREMGGFFLDITPNREAISRYGVSVRDVLDVVQTSIGGMDISTTFEGRERYQINVRYPRELRDNIETLRDILVPVQVIPSKRAQFTGSTPGAGDGQMPQSLAERGMSISTGPMNSNASGMPPGIGIEDREEMGDGAMNSPNTAMGAGVLAKAYVPLGQLATIETAMGPSMIKSEMGSLTGWVYIDTQERDIGGYVENAKQAVAREVKIPPGYSLKWTGQYEFLERVRTRLAYVLPITLSLIFAILYLNFRGVAQTLIVMTAVPFAAVGAIWTLFFLRFNTSVAVWVGMIALLGVAAETASVMVVYMDEAWEKGRQAGTITSLDDLRRAAAEAGSLRVRALLMTVMTNIFGLLPVLLDDGVGSDVAKRIAAPMWGGLVSLTLLTLLVVPSMYVLWRGFKIRPIP